MQSPSAFGFAFLHDILAMTARGRELLRKKIVSLRRWIWVPFGLAHLKAPEAGHISWEQRAASHRQKSVSDAAAARAPKAQISDE